MLDYEKLARMIYGKNRNLPAGGDPEPEGSPNFVGPVRENGAPTGGGPAVEGSVEFVGPVKESQYIDSWLVKDVERIFRGQMKEPAPVYSERQEGPPESIWPARDKVTSPYTSSRLHPTYGVKKPHYAIDIGNPLRGEVVASRAGIVASVAPTSYGTNQVIVFNSDGTRSGYAHVTPDVKVGQQVNAGELLGFTDLSRPSNGPHLHYSFSTSRDGSRKIDPLLSLPGKNNFPERFK